MMRINKLVIYGFGKHTDVTVELADGINVLHGGNEAGKTTMRQFILHTLFGFPQRNTNLLRYEPKAGGAYGGRLHLTDPEYGPCVIERVSGRSAGEVTVRLADGREGGEELLAQILRGHDRQSFESVFSFSLIQLQEIGHMNEEELGRALIASGTTGADDLAAFETKLQKELDGLFKKSGRVPAVNALLGELRDMEEELADCRKKAEGYAPMKERSAEIRRRLEELAEENGSLERRRRRLLLMRQALPLESARRQTRRELDEIGEAPFPQDGVRRYESLKDKALAAGAAGTSLRERIGKLEEAMPEEPSGELVSGVKAALAEESAWHEAKAAAARAGEALSELGGIKAGLLGRLGLSGSRAESLVHADASLKKEEELHALTSRRSAAGENRRMLAGRLADKEAELARTREQRKHLESAGPDDREMERAAAWPGIRRKLAAIEAKRKPGTAGKSPVLILAALGVLLAVIAVFTRQWLLLPAGLLVAASAYLFRDQGGKDGLTIEEQRLLDEYGGREDDMDRLADRVRRHFAELDRAAETEKQLRAEKAGLQEKLTQAEADLSDSEKELMAFVAGYGITGLPSAALVPELFRLVRETQEAFRREQAELQRRDQALRKMEGIRQTISGLIGGPAADDLLFGKLKDLDAGISSAESERARMLAELGNLEEELRENETYLQQIREQARGLLKEAEVSDEAGFYKAAGQSARKAELEKELAAAVRQLGSLGHPEFEGEPDDAALAEELEQCSDTLEKLAQERDRLLGERADIEAKMDHLLTDRAYDERLQEFEMKKAEFRRLSRNWAARKAAAAAIGRTVGRMKEETLPDAVSRAGRLFARLTGGAYSAIVLGSDGRFTAENRSGMRFAIHELSQATKEQAYISLRLALAGTLQEQAPFPIILDDPFVHFDRERLGHMVNLMEELKTNHQFLYFTCHENMAGAFKDAAVIDVAGTGSGKGVLQT